MMRRTIYALLFAAVIGGVATLAAAQTQPTPQTPSSPQGHRGGGCSMMSGGGSGMMGAGGGMGGMMSGGMMGMMPGGDARTMQMRGEMMKAMGDIMMKYGKQMEGSGK